MSDFDISLSMFVLVLFLAAILYAGSLAARLGRGKNGRPRTRHETKAQKEHAFNHGSAVMRYPKSKPWFIDYGKGNRHRSDPYSGKDY